ncbi:MAG: tetratricopeptide repeat protein [Burkholderiales bacterium]
MGKKKRRRNWVGDFLLGLILVAITMAAYQQVWHAGYIWNDDACLTANPLLTATDGLKRIWLTLDSPSQYFPLVYTTFRLEHAFWGLNPAGFHWVNISLHAANALLVWMLLRTLRIPGAWLAAVLFALHPVQVESVAWITERTNVLMGFFFLLTLICWARFMRKEQAGRWWLYVAALVFYAFALSSKTTACTIPAALLLMLWLKRKPIDLARVAQVTPFVILGVGAGMVSIWWERYHQGTQTPLFAIGFGERVLLASRSIWFYLEKLVWPNELSFNYPRWPISLTNPADYLWLGITIAAALLLWFLRRYTGRSLEVAFVFFVATLAPVLGFIMLDTFRYSWVADHYQYMAALGPLALFAAGVDLLSQRFGRLVNWVVAIGGAALLVSLGTRTWKQGAIYADEETLWRATLATNPKSWLAHNNLGTVLARHGQTEDELLEYHKAIELDPDYAEAHYNLGNTLARLNQDDEAVSEYDKALALYPRLAPAHANIATVLMRLGRSGEAISHLREALALQPRDASLKRSLGDLLARENKPAEAIENWKGALEIDPNDPGAAGTLGRALAESGQAQDGLVYLRRASELAPQSAEAHYNYATALSQLGRLTEAISEYGAALEIRPDYAAAHVNLATSLLQSDRTEEAIKEYKRGLELNPNSFAAHRNLALALHALGRTTEAEEHAIRAAEIEAGVGNNSEP